MASSTRPRPPSHGGARPPVSLTGSHAEAAPAATISLGGVRIDIRRAADVPTVLEPLLQLANRKNVATLLGVSPRTLLRWQQNGDFPALEGRTMGQVLGWMLAEPGSGTRPLAGVTSLSVR